MKKQLLITAGVALATAGFTFAEDKVAAAESKGQQELSPEQQAQMEQMIKQFQEQQQQQPAIPNMSLEEAKLFFSRNIGVNIGSQLRGDEMVLKDEFLAGLNEALEGKVDASKIDQAKMTAAQQVIQTAMAEKQQAEGKIFLEENKKKEGVKVTESGLQYKVVKAGEGDSPTAQDRVKVHYTGKFIDGTVFDSSVERGAPATFGVTQVIPGWIEGLQLMNTGAKYEFVIPSEIAYGPRGQGSIPPNSILVFDVEMIEIIKPAAPVEAKQDAPAEKKTDSPAEVK